MTLYLKARAMRSFSSRREPCRQKLLLLIALLVLAVQERPARAQEHNEAIKRQFLEAAPKRWTEYVRLAEMMQGKMTSHMVESPSGNDVGTVEFRTNGRGWLFTTESLQEKEDRQNPIEKEVFGANPKYAFQLRRTAPDAAWIVMRIVDLSKEELPDRWRQLFDLAGVEVTSLIRLDAEPLSEIVQNPTFQVDRCQAVRREGEEFVEVAFAYERGVRPAARPGLVKGTILFDPKRFWCVRSADYSVEFKNDERYQSGTGTWRLVDVGEASGSLPITRVCEWDRYFFQNTGHKDRLLYRTEFDIEVPNRLPGDEEFTLSAFGLPEPRGLEWKRPTPWYLWLGLAGIVCLALGVVIRKVTNRRTTVT